MNWKRDILLIPLIVGVLVALVTFGLPLIFDRGARLSYSVEGPISYISEAPVKGVSVTVQGQPVDRLFHYRVKVWNSGSKPLKDIPVLYSFEPSSPSVKVYVSYYATVPEREFGKVTEDSQSAGGKRFIYELLNPKDEVTTTFLTDSQKRLQVYSRGEGLKIELVKTEEKGRPFEYLQYVPAIIAGLASILTVAIKDSSLIELLTRRFRDK